MKKIILKSFLSGSGFTALLWMGAIASADDWKHEMFDTESSELFARMLLYPSFFILNVDVSIRLFYLPPILYSFAFFAIFFTIALIRNNRAPREEEITIAK